MPRLQIPRRILAPLFTRSKALGPVLRQRKDRQLAPMRKKGLRPLPKGPIRKALVQGCKQRLVFVNALNYTYTERQTHTFSRILFEESLNSLVFLRLRQNPLLCVNIYVHATPTLMDGVENACARVHGRPKRTRTHVHSVRWDNPTAKCQRPIHERSRSAKLSGLAERCPRISLSARGRNH